MYLIKIADVQCSHQYSSSSKHSMRLYSTMFNGLLLSLSIILAVLQQRYNIVNGMRTTATITNHNDTTSTSISTTTSTSTTTTTTTTAISQRSAKSQLLQHFRAPRINNHTQYKEIIFLALLPSREADNKNDCVLSKVLPVLELAITYIQRLGFFGATNVDVSLISRDTFCSSIYGPIGFFEIYTQFHEINAVFGLPCEYVLAPISRYAGVWQIPILTTGGNAGEFDKKAESYSTLTRLKGAQVNNLGNVVLAIVENFNWTRTALIYQNSDVKVKGNSVCFFCIVVLHDKLRELSVLQQGFDTSIWKKSDIQKMLTNISKQSRIVIMCADPQSIRQIMLTAEELNMIDNGEYVFINIELFSRVSLETSQPWFDKNDTVENNERARKAYTAMLTVAPKQPNDAEYIRVSNEIKKIAALKYNYTFHDNEPISTFVTSFFDGVLLYANALNESIREDPSVLTRPINGTDMVRRMWNRNFTGITGNVSIDANGDRISAYSLLDMNPQSGRYEIVGHFLHNHLEFIPGKVIHWAGDRLEPPPDRPICGYDGSLCPDNSLPGYAILSIVLGIVVVMMIVCFLFGYKHYKSEAEINSMAWKVSRNDIMFHQLDGRCFRGSFYSLVRQNSQMTMMSDDMYSFSGDKQIFIPIGVFKGCKVAIKMIEENNINLTRSIMLELKRMKDLQHDHLVKFYGACLDPPKSFLLTEYCPKGSLQDILENEQFQLDWMFKLSLMHDIVRGMQFLHNSDIKSHGNLKSSNCVVDSRFVLKITDFGLHSLRKSASRYDKDSDIENCNSHAYWSKLLWTSPELLKMELNRPPEGTQKGDVYSFGIIVHEIITRQGPFYLGNDVPTKSPQEIIELVKGYPYLTQYPFRPRIDNGETNVDIINLMTKCWSEEPFERPDFNALKTTIGKINRNNETGNIVDNLLKRMEQYANNLEELVEERTQDYMEEKKKCEKLLYQLLPQSVAAQLIRGQPVVAETFDQVTIYFSDIVGFTAISAESTPMQVVQFLNDLYTCFDSIVENFDVYKVETIGDAYMVVSGLPIRNGNAHAREIARLALALLEAVHNFTIHHRPNDRLKLRIGLHTGPCVAGVVGMKMPRYCLFGDTVNTASRMESNGEALKIHISENTKLALDAFDTFVTTQRGYVPMKGKGEMLTYWLEGEVPKPESPISQRKLLLSRRSSLKHSLRYNVHKQQPPTDLLLPSSYDEESEMANDEQISPVLHVHRKISSSSPKLNVCEYKTGDAHSYYYVEPMKAIPKEKCNQLKLNDFSNDVNSSRSLRESNAKNNPNEVVNLRLPLSGALKSHNNSNNNNNNSLRKHSYSQLIHSKSNSNLSGVLNVANRIKLKASPTISTLVANSRSELDGRHNRSGSIIKFNVAENLQEANDIATGAPSAAAAAEEHVDDDESDDNNDGAEQYMLHNATDGSSIYPNNLNVNNSLYHNNNSKHIITNSSSSNSNSMNNFKDIVKVNNVRNLKLLSPMKASNNIAEHSHTTTTPATTSAGTTVKHNSVTQPLLATINT